MNRTEQNRTEQNRIYWVDIAKYICIVCVVLVHMESCTNVLKELFTPFYLTLFFFLSGYVHKQIDFKLFFLKKIKQLFVPWFIFSILNVLMTFVVNGRSEEYRISHGSLGETLIKNFLQIRGLDDGMWFVAALFITYIPFYFFIKHYNQDRNEKKLLLLVVILAVISALYSKMMPNELLPWGKNALPWHTEYIFIAMFYMILGYLYKEKYEKIITLKFDNTIKHRIVITIIYVLMIIGTTIFENNVVTAVIYSFVLAVVGIVTVIAWCKKARPNRYVLYIGRNTLLVFALHNYIFRIIEKVLWSKFNGFYVMVLENDIISTLFALIFAFIVTIILIIPIYVIENYFPWMIGRK